MAFLSQNSASHNIQLAGTALVSVAVGAAAVLAAQRLRQEARVSRLKRSIPTPDDDDDDENVPQKLGAPLRAAAGLPNPDKEDLRNAALARRAQAGDFDDELILEQLARNRVFLTPAGLDRLRGASVVVVGCGGVGSHCAAALARSGVGALRLVDFDQVTLSSLNRHAVATLADVGLPKVQCLQRRLVAITPWVAFDLRLEKYDDRSAERLLGPWEGEGNWKGRMPDFVVDAIDNIDTKVHLLKYCHDHKLPVISSMGAGCKSDPTKIMIGDIGTSISDSLSRTTRRRLKLQGVTSGIPVVYSTETAGEGKAELLPLPEEEFQKGTVGDLGVLPDFRVRILPVLGTLPAMFGLSIANHIILHVAGYPVDYVAFKGRHKMHDAILAALQSSEEKIVRMTEDVAPELAIGLRIPVTTGDVAFLVEELYKGKSAISDLAARVLLIRWRRPKQSILVRIETQKSSNLRLRDLVCMTRDEAIRHQREVLQGDKAPEDIYDADTIARVEAKLKEAEAFERYR